jgi:hypothetical protein
MADTYFDALKTAQEAAATVLEAKGVSARYLAFGGPGEKPAKKITVPTNANSEFLANRAMGDWAEKRFAEAVLRGVKAYKSVPYGEADSTAAGEPGFAEMFRGKAEDTRLYGKRPDVLIFPRDADVPGDLSACAMLECDRFVQNAAAAVEVRSSKFDALTYMKVRAEQRKQGKKVRDTPSFTVKVEDLKIVYRWIERTRVPQAYVQIFFDTAFGINFLDVFRIVGNDEGFTIETPAKSQEKSTILIPITAGRQLGRFASQPVFVAEHHMTTLGRHDAYVRPEGGKLVLDEAELTRILMPRF